MITGALAGITLGVVLVLLPSLLGIPYIWLLAWFLLVFTTWQSAFLWSQRACAEKSLLYRFFVSLFLFQVIGSSIVAYAGFFGTLTVTSELFGASGLLLVSLYSLNRAFAGCCQRGKLSVDITRPFVALGVVTAVLAFGIMALNCVRYPTMESDALTYHLPMVAEWMKNGSIWPTVDSPIPNLQIGFPGFREALMAFLALPVGNEHLGDIGVIEPVFFWLSLYFSCPSFLRFCSARGICSHLWINYTSGSISYARE